jgi:hypothetical protein
MEEDRLKSEILNGHQEVLGSFVTVRMTHLPLHHHGNYSIGPIVFILSEHVCQV